MNGNENWRHFDGLVCGVDEAGRGPWAGPVVAAAVILPAQGVPEGLADSKALSAKRREALFPMIMAVADVGIGSASVAEIDELNILNATLLAMRRAVDGLGQAPDLALVDGNRPPDLRQPVECIIKGDAKVPAISAASIIAKVTRDREMQALARQYPDYGWEKNAGYGTAQHRAGLDKSGVTPHHRRSFAPIRALCEAGEPE